MSRTYYIFSSGRFRRQDNSLMLETSEGKQPVPIENVDHIYCFSDMDINSRLLELLAKNQVCLHFFNLYGHYTGSFVPRAAF
jgi:CRISPR-associated protein Cas1